MNDEASLPPLADPAKVSLREFSTPEEFVAAHSAGETRVTAPPMSHFRAKMTRIDLDRVRVRVGESTSSVSMVACTPDCHAFVLATRPAPPRILSGREVLEPFIFHPRPSEEMHGASPSGAPWPWTTLTFSCATLACDGAALAGRSVAPSRRDVAIIRAPDTARRRLLYLVSIAAHLAATQPAITDTPAARALSGAILEAMTDCLTQGELITDRAASRRHDQIMARLETLLRERAEDVLTLADICAAVGVGARSLQQICQAFTGIGVMQYVRAHRLKQVRRALQEADARRTRVADVAMRYGFWELGRFSGAYRTMFGELPSATLRG